MFTETRSLENLVVWLYAHYLWANTWFNSVRIVSWTFLFTGPSRSIPLLKKISLPATWLMTSLNETKQNWRSMADSVLPRGKIVTWCPLMTCSCCCYLRTNQQHALDFKLIYTLTHECSYRLGGGNIFCLRQFLSWQSVWTFECRLKPHYA